MFIHGIAKSLYQYYNSLPLALANGIKAKAKLALAKLIHKKSAWKFPSAFCSIGARGAYLQALY
jgi:hypothetical protein